MPRSDKRGLPRTVADNAGQQGITGVNGRQKKTHGDEVEAFVMFISEDGKQVSDSVYTGRLEATAG